MSIILEIREQGFPTGKITDRWQARNVMCRESRNDWEHQVPEEGHLRSFLFTSLWHLLKWHLMKRLPRLFDMKKCPRPMSLSSPHPNASVSWNLPTATSHIHQVLSLSLHTVEDNYHEKRSCVAGYALSLSNWLESHEYSTSVYPMSNLFINTNINNYVCEAFKNSAWHIVGPVSRW